MVEAIERIAIVGAGVAGLRTVERLRHRGFLGELVLLGAERHLPYDRPPLSKEVLRGERDDASLRPDNDFSGLDVTLRLDDRAESLDVERGLIYTRSGRLHFDSAVIATGAVPRRVPGVSGYVLRTIDDSRRLREQLRPGRRLGIIGAGLIGCEVAASARAMQVEVELIDVLAGPLIRVVGPKVADRIAELHDAHGVNMRMGIGVATCEGRRLGLSDGSEFEADIVLEAIGAAPDIEWLRDSALSLGDGVLCDEHGQAAPDVYAVGDVACWDGVRTEHWASAGRQADRVAAAILRQEQPPRDVPYWWSDQYDVKLQGLGRPGPDDDVEVVVWGPRARTIAVYSNQGRLTGVVGFSSAGPVMRLRDDIVAGTDVNEVLTRLTDHQSIDAKKTAS